MIFSGSVMDSGGRMDAVYPLRQIVIAIVNGVTRGLVAPGVQRASGSGWRAAVKR
jgi:hypothetical protein